MKNTAFLRCTANRAVTGNKLHFQPKHQVRAKLAAINNKNGCGTAKMRCRQFGSVSYHWYYHVRSVKRYLCSVVPSTKSAQAISSIFSPKIQLWPNWQQSTTKMAMARLRCDTDSLEVLHNIDTYHMRSGKRQLFSVRPPTKSAQSISSIFSPKPSFGQIGSNQQQKWLWNG